MTPQPSPAGGPPVNMQVHAFTGLMQGVAVVAGLTHLSFLILFVWVGVEALAAVNVGSVLCYVWALTLARRGRAQRSWAIIATEVLAHAILATAMIGWESGFHYYILLVIPVGVVSNIRPLWLKWGTVLFVALTYLGLSLAVRGGTPPEMVPEKTLEALYYFNVAGTIVILAFLATCYHYFINQAQQRLTDMATTDPLTGLRNRRAMVEAIRSEEERTVRRNLDLSFIICDLDRFKLINDGHGHEAGDLVLQATGQALKDGLRQVDELARWGGEEFLIMLPDTDEATALEIAERLRKDIESLTVSFGDVEQPISMTVGVATLQDGETPVEAIARADIALYAGKNAGRNLVVQN